MKASAVVTSLSCCMTAACLLMAGTCCAASQDKNLGTPLEGCGDCAPFEFCGTDQQCHSYNCEAWFVAGPPKFTLASEVTWPNPLDLLDCRALDKDHPDTNFYNAQPLCESGAPSLAVTVWDGPPPPLWWQRFCEDHQQSSLLAALPWDRKCTAAWGNTGFVCYDVSSATALLDYEEKVKQLSLEFQGNVSNVTTFDPSYVFLTEMTGFSNVFETNDETGQSFGYTARIQYQHGMPAQLDSYSRDRTLATLHTQLFEMERDVVIPYNCRDGCPVGTFCGTDEACHAMGDCQIFFEFGPTSLTGRVDPDNSPALNCTLEYQLLDDSDYSLCPKTGDDSSAPPQWPLAVSYECSLPNVVGGASVPCPQNYTQGRELPFSRMCTSQPNANQSFVCFDTVGMSKADIIAFEEKVQENGQCTVHNVPLVGQEWTRASNWTLCEDFAGECFRASLVYGNRAFNDVQSTFVDPYPSRRDILSNRPTNDEMVVDQTILSRTMISKLSGPVPVVNVAPRDSNNEESSGTLRRNLRLGLSLSSLLIALA